MEYTEKSLGELLNISQPALFKALKNIFFELKQVEGSTKPVKHYKYDDLPSRYKEKLKELGVVKEEEREDVKITNISKTNFTKKYLLVLQPIYSDRLPE
ncbi:hypothetical protein O8C86_01415 [Aliarcobacter butzleri]|uniref:hypothetical protein n=1 Tax=Aliarcobacter butzleri TaxID=28197 RepID=UPI00263D1C4C|nr:hypothetical protein [Aliarcobacter butzleri]MDN5060494.1 hypothetical protein [Aliarcobacter butzleri]